jgi:hypothetical protein
VAAQSKAAMRAGNKAIQFLPTLRLGFFALCAKFRLDGAAGTHHHILSQEQNSSQADESKYLRIISLAVSTGADAILAAGFDCETRGLPRRMSDETDISQHNSRANLPRSGTLQELQAAAHRLPPESISCCLMN